MNVAHFNFPRTSVKMFKFAIFSAILFAARVIAQDNENYEICDGLDDETQVGVGYDISCTKYYFCSGGVGLLEDCTEIFGDPDLAFNEETGLCEYDVVCGDGGRDDPDSVEKKVNDLPADGFVQDILAKLPGLNHETASEIRDLIMSRRGYRLV